MKRYKLITISIIIITIIIFTLGIAGSDTPSESMPKTGNYETVDDAETGSYKEVENGEILIDDILSEMDFITESKNLALFFDHKTAGIAVMDKRSGNVWFSNPVDLEQYNSIEKNVKSQILSQLRIFYYDKRNIEKEMNSYVESVQRNGQFVVTEVSNGIRVEMKLGREEPRRLLPKALPVESFENVLENIESDRALARLNVFYTFYSLDKEMSDSLRKSLIDRYPGIIDQDIYALGPVAAEKQKLELEGYFIDAGYTFEQLERDYAITGMDALEEILPFFSIPIEYTLDDDSLVVRVPVEEIQYDKDIYTLQKMNILQYFGAGTGEDGYLFIPDGSGSLLNFNHDSSKRTQFISGRVYGHDIAIPRTVSDGYRRTFGFPVYGIKDHDKAFIAIIEEGDAMSEIRTELGNFSHPYNGVSAFQIVRDFQEVDLQGFSARSSMRLLDKNAYKGDYKLRFMFMDGDEANYAGMAKTYRTYLEDRGHITKIEDDKDIPFYLETLGTIYTNKSVFGISMTIKEPLTTFDQADELVNQLTGLNVSNIHLRYKGWYNGGLNNRVASSLSVERKLGGRRGLNQLIDSLEKKSVSFFPDVDFMMVSKVRLFDGFTPRSDSIRTLNRRIAGLMEVSAATNLYDRDTLRYAVSPDNLTSHYNKFMGSYANYGIDNISVGTMGEYLYSDFRSRNSYNREESKSVVDGILATKNNNKYMFDYGNAYVFPYASHILNMPMTDSGYTVADKSVPFLQIALHGYIDYAGKPLNLSDDYRLSFLKSLETGSGVYFTMIYNDSSVLKDTSFSEYYSINYEIWMDEASNIYEQMNNVLKEVRGMKITDHKQLQDDVFKTVFENGREIIVNYGNEYKDINGTKIEPLGYIVIDSER